MLRKPGSNYRYYKRDTSIKIALDPQKLNETMVKMKTQVPNMAKIDLKNIQKNC